MSIATYAELQTAVASWMNRTDLTATIPDFIVSAEGRIARDLRVSRMITTGTLTTTIAARGVTLPSTWLEFKSLRVADKPLSYVPAETINDYDDITDANVYSIEGGQLLLGPIPATAYTVDIKYYSRITALATTTTNWLLTSHPFVYLYGALIEGAIFTMNDGAASKWGQLYQKTIDELHSEDRRAMISGSHLRMRSMYP